MSIKQIQQTLCVVNLGIFLLAAQLSATDSHKRPQQPQSGISWAQQAMLALTGGTQVTSLTENGSVTWTIGNNQGTGNIAMQSSSNTNSQITLSTTAGNRTETRSWASDGSGPIGQWTDLQGNQHQMAQYNCWTDAVWFFPALSMLSDNSDPTMIYNDLGPEQYNGHNVEHIQAYRFISSLPQDVEADLQRLSTVNYYLDSQTAIPVAMTFSTHADTDMNVNLPVVLTFTQYQTIDGIQVPLTITRFHGGSPLYQMTINNATVNGQGSPDRHP